ncbi:MAG TPA: hypothetical protein VHL99_08555, partial [Candidatus Binatia bacterium]|nr:hypothetical protein [Candidatus Binatia bacterium]
LVECPPGLGEFRLQAEVSVRTRQGIEYQRADAIGVRVGRIARIEVRWPAFERDNEGVRGRLILSAAGGEKRCQGKYRDDGCYRIQSFDSNIQILL